MTKDTVLNLISRYSDAFLLNILDAAKANNHTEVVNAVEAELLKRKTVSFSTHKTVANGNN